MKRWEIVLALVGAAALGLSAWALRVTEPPHRDVIIAASDCHMPATILEPIGHPRGAAIVFHGLAADRRIMGPIGRYLSSEENLRVYLFDLSGHGDNTDAFSFASADACARLTLESLIRSGQIDPKRTILMGHSMGGAIAIRAADRSPVAGTIALSPAPTPLPRRMPSNLLVFSAQFDLPILKRAAQTLAQAAGGERTSTDDFLQSRAFHLEVMPFSDHVSLLDDSRVLERVGYWTDDILDGARRKQAGAEKWDETNRWNLLTMHHASLADDLREALTLYPALVPMIGLVGIFLLFPFFATFTTDFAAPRLDDLAALHPPITLALAEGAVCALATALLLEAFVPLTFLRLYTGDYFASLLLIAGILLLALNWRGAKQSLRFNARPFFAAAALSFAVMIGVGAWLNWQTADLWLNASRGLRFAALVPLAWIFCFAEEVVLGPVGHGRARAARFAVCLGLRAELWLACLLTYYALASGQVLILILVATLAIFSILQRLATDALRMRTGSPAAAAIFGAILAAWFIAAIFPLT
jgi:pimeloyl-ACP methyl ester carboxylesterase